MIKTFILWAGILFAASVHSGDTTGKIGKIFFHTSNDRVLFKMESDNWNLTDCATTRRYGFSVNSNRGQAMLSAVLAAKMSDQEITVVGANNCSIHPDAESINYLYMP